MAATAYALHFIKNVGWTSGFAFGLFAAFITWIILSSKKEEMARIVALVLVFIVVIFFWMSFHQNGLTLTLYARDYTAKQVGPFTNLFFTLPSHAGCCRFNCRTCIACPQGILIGEVRIAGGIFTCNFPDIFILSADRI